MAAETPIRRSVSTSETGRRTVWIFLLPPNGPVRQGCANLEPFRAGCGSGGLSVDLVEVKTGSALGQFVYSVKLFAADGTVSRPNAAEWPLILESMRIPKKPSIAARVASRLSSPNLDIIYLGARQLFSLPSRARLLSSLIHRSSTSALESYAHDSTTCKN